jgi:hypothetical protein
MTSNLDRFSNDLERLIDRGKVLRLAMEHEIHPDRFKSSRLSKDDIRELIKSLPDFTSEYDSWYSEALALLKQLLPDRVNNFISFYEKPKTRKELTYGNYVIQDYLQGTRVTRGMEEKVGPSAAYPQFVQQLSILNAAKRRFESSLFQIKQLVQADLFDSEVEAARELHKNKYLRPAGVLAGVVLEKHLRQVCADHGINVIKKNPTLSDLNELLKSNGVIDMADWRRIGFLADIRNLCAHGKGVEPTAEQVSDLLDGTEKVIKTVV